MSYTNRLLTAAKKLDVCLSVQRDEISFLYKVDLNLVHLKDGYARRRIYGMGFTIEDACYDFIRKCHGLILIHAISDKEAEIR